MTIKEMSSRSLIDLRRQMCGGSARKKGNDFLSVLQWVGSNLKAGRRIPTHLRDYVPARLLARR